MANASNFVTKAESEIREIKNLVWSIKEKSRKLLTEYTRLGSNSFTNKHFYVDGDVNGTERTDLNYTKDQFATAIGNMATFAGMEWDGTAGVYKDSATNDLAVSRAVMETIVIVTG